MSEDLALLHTTGHGMGTTTDRSSVRDAKMAHRDYKILAMHLAGYKQKDIAEQLGLGIVTVSRVLNSDRVLRLRQQILQTYELEFELQMPGVLELLRTKMDSEDEAVQLRAIDMYLKMFGKYKPKDQSATLNLTAEDVVFNILNQS